MAANHIVTPKPSTFAKKADALRDTGLAGLAGAGIGGLYGLITAPRKQLLRSVLRGAAIGGAGGAGFGLAGHGIGSEVDKLHNHGQSMGYHDGVSGGLATGVGASGAGLASGLLVKRLLDEYAPAKAEEQASKKQDPKFASARTFGEKLALNLGAIGTGLGGGAGLGALAGGLYGALNPGEEETLDDNGRIVKRQKGRIGSALMGALGGAGIGGLAGAGLGALQPGNVQDYGAKLKATLARAGLHGADYNVPAQGEVNVGDEYAKQVGPPAVGAAQSLVGPRAEFLKQMKRVPAAPAEKPDHVADFTKWLGGMMQSGQTTPAPAGNQSMVTGGGNYGNR